MSYLERIDKSNAALAKLAKARPATIEGFTALHEASAAGAALDVRTRELIALAISVATRCEDCIAFHTRDAIKAGVSKDEIMAMLSVAIYMGGGPSLMYAAHVVEAMEQFSAA